ncbi:hypothetical protein K443DRAFT_420395 [Laccaria amethystina LaAM-08-1]|uniref:Uncharacterized protein n=1 Tax=Laccaria amethystina LaAM-08-1 TaxID=1095629 RepID=A0A0C9X588_9AGAR|nr:hypothetical protein K443DRAFT_420395 [Laccaria amethystina LaAM-08-1]
MTEAVVPILKCFVMERLTIYIMVDQERLQSCRVSYAAIRPACLGLPTTRGPTNSPHHGPPKKTENVSSTQAQTHPLPIRRYHQVVEGCRSPGSVALQSRGSYMTIFEYLPHRDRPDTIRCIVAYLVGDNSDGGDALADENELIVPLQQVTDSVDDHGDGTAGGG